MKKIFLVLLVFGIISSGIVAVILFQTQKTTDEIAQASGSKSIILKDFIDDCAVFTSAQCGNVNSNEELTLSYSRMTTILAKYPQSPLTRYMEPVPLLADDPRLLPPQDTASHLLIQASREAGINFKAMVGLSSAIGADPVRRSDADMKHPFKNASPLDGFYAQSKDVATTLHDLKEKREYTLHVGNKTYEVTRDASDASLVLYQFIAMHAESPEQFERIVLPANKKYADNLFNVWKAVLQEDLIIL